MTDKSNSAAFVASILKSLSGVAVESLRVRDLLLPHGATFCTKPGLDGRFTAACQDGILVPIIVDQEHYLIDGMRRCQAAWTLDERHVPAKVIPQILTESERLLLRVLLNPDRTPNRSTLLRIGWNPVRDLPVDKNSILPKLARAEKARRARDQERRNLQEFTGGGKHGVSQSAVARHIVAAYEGIQEILRHYPQKAPEAMTTALVMLAQAAQRVINFRQA